MAAWPHAWPDILYYEVNTMVDTYVSSLVKTVITRKCSFLVSLPIFHNTFNLSTKGL